MFGFGQLIDILKKDPKKIVFTEGDDPRILEAASRLLAGTFLHPILIGNPDKIAAEAEECGFNIRGAEIIDPTTDTVKYSDGYTEEVNGFDIPVPAIGEEFNVAILGEKGKWYDHKVSVKNPVKTSDDKKSEGKKPEELKLEDGTYETDVTLTGGSGRASVESPAKVEIKDKEATATIIWSSPNYDYMIVDGEKYEPVNKDGNSTFEIPVTVFDAEMEVTADTVAMSTPHEIEYTLNFDSSSMKKEEK